MNECTACQMYSQNINTKTKIMGTTTSSDDWKMLLNEVRNLQILRGEHRRIAHGMVGVFNCR